MASLGWVTPGAATEGVTPLFFSEKPGDLSLLIAVTITIAFYCFHWGVTFPGCHPTHFSPHTFFTCPTSFLHYSLCVNLPTNFFSFGCHPHGGCHQGRSAPTPHPLVMPLFASDNRKCAVCRTRIDFVMPILISFNLNVLLLL